MIFGYSGNSNRSDNSGSKIEAKVSGISDLKAIIQYVDSSKSGSSKETVGIRKHSPVANKKRFSRFIHYQGVKPSSPMSVEDSKAVEEILHLNGFKILGQWWIKSLV